MQFSPNTPF